MGCNIEERYDLAKKVYQVGRHSLEIWQLEDFEKAVTRLIDEVADETGADVAPEDCPYFGQIWSSALYLANIANTLSNEGLFILELGCGLALPSMVASRNGAKCLAVDVHPDVEWFVQKNASVNGVADRIEYRRLDWRHDDLAEKFDLIMGSDILYENDHPKDVLKFISKHMSSNGKAIIVDPCRWHHLDFCKIAESAGFHFESCYDTVEEDGQPVKIHVVTLSWPQE